MKAQEVPAWYNAMQWTGAESMSDVEDFFTGPGGLNMSAIGYPYCGASLDAEDNTILVIDWRSGIGDTRVPLGYWMVSKPSWGDDVTAGWSGEEFLHSNQNFQDRFVTNAARFS